MLTSRTPVFLIFVLAWSSAAVATAQQSDYARVKVGDGPVIQYPSHWLLLDEATVKNRALAAKAIAESAQADISGYQKRDRVVIQSVPSPNGAQIRASLVTPVDFSERDLQAATPADLQSIATEFEGGMRKAAAAGSVKFDQMGRVRVERVGGKLALVIPYTMHTDPDMEQWHVEQVPR